jgi:hypothetical protein
MSLLTELKTKLAHVAINYKHFAPPGLTQYPQPQNPLAPVILKYHNFGALTPQRVSER